MTYAQSVEYLLGLGHETVSIKLGLETIRALLHELCHPHQMLRTVHIAGTNGKGSTAAMVAEMADAEGLRTGLYTSPHLVEITERISINGKRIDHNDFARLASRVRIASENLVHRGSLPAPPSFFEQVTAIAFCYFAESKIDVEVLEVGLGGRLDATNICRPEVCAITPISGDHQSYLGHSISEIAFEKAGIIKPGVRVVSAPQSVEAMDVIERRCRELHAPLIIAQNEPRIEASEDGFFRMSLRTSLNEYDVKLGLRGRHQVTNALVAIHLAELLRFRKSSIEAGLKNVQWRGRLDLIRRKGKAALLIDGAHNPEGSKTLRSFIDEFYPLASTPVTLVFGAMSDKALDEMIRTLFPAAQRRIAVPIDNPRSVDPHVIVRVAGDQGYDATAAKDSREGLRLADDLTPENGLVCVCGSLYLVGEMYDLPEGREGRREEGK